MKCYFKILQSLSNYLVNTNKFSLECECVVLKVNRSTAVFKEKQEVNIIKENQSEGINPHCSQCLPILFTFNLFKTDKIKFRFSILA